nr:MAG TPA: hypothetical protein [Caudoviricetes sp.]
MSNPYLFQTITLTLVSSLRCGNMVLKSFQQFKAIHCIVSKCSGLSNAHSVP